MNVVIIGSGMAGTAAGDHLASRGQGAVLYEAKPYWGGHTASRVDDGFVFDEGPHVSFTDNTRVRDVFTRGAVQVETLNVQITNAYKGRWIPHPAQCHLFGLDPNLVAKCLTDFVKAQGEAVSPRNYADWCIGTFGRTFAETFPFAYTRKYWTVEARQMSTDWISKRIYPPKLEEVFRGALSQNQSGNFHYLTECRYPTRGGYQSFMRAMHRPESVRLGHELTSVDVKKRHLRFSNGAEAGYDHLISTMPLPDLIGVIKRDQVPQGVLKAARKLLCSSLVLVDLAVNRPDLFDKHWFYVYDEDLCASRVHFPHKLSPKNAPPGKGSIQAEIYHSRHRPLPCSPDSLVEGVVEEMTRLGILSGPREVLWTRHREVPYANVVFDLHRKKALKTLLPWVKKQGIHLAGRYAEWGYHWTDDATVAGWTAAEGVLREIDRPSKRRVSCRS